jgi:predicted nucleic acid-binding protein
MSRDRRGCVPGREVPDEMAISVVTLAERSAGSHEVRPDTEQDVYFEAAERARRLDVLQRAEHEFDPIPFDTDAARAYGRVTAAVIAAGRKPRRRVGALPEPAAGVSVTPGTCQDRLRPPGNRTGTVARLMYTRRRP